MNSLEPIVGLGIIMVLIWSLYMFTIKVHIFYEAKRFVESMAGNRNQINANVDPVLNNPPNDEVGLIVAADEHESSHQNQTYNDKDNNDQNTIKSHRDQFRKILYHTEFSLKSQNDLER